MDDANLFTYVDKVFTVMGDTMITFNGDYKAFALPSEVEGHQIKKLGQNLLYNNRIVKQVVVQEGIEEIASGVFCFAHNLIEVKLPASLKVLHPSAFSHSQEVSRVVARRRLSLGEYEAMKQGAFFVEKGGNKFYILPNVRDDLECLKIIYDALENIAGPIDSLDKSMTGVCVYTDREFKDATRRNIFEYQFGGKAVHTEESVIILDKIRNQVPEYVHEKAEQQSDINTREGKQPQVQKTVLTMFDDSQTEFVDGECICTFYFEIDYYFWPSIKPVMMDGTKYYIYRRHHINSDKDCPYVRADMSITCVDGGSMSNELKEKVLAKYKLLSLF